MTPERWRQIEQVYHQAMACEPQHRAAWVAEACCSDDDLKKEVESLLAFPDTSPRILLNRTAILETALADQLDSSSIGGLAPGVRLGPYEIERELGAGGMALVWKARDTRLGRTVALKISKAGFSDRFEREARAVAALNHPHILSLIHISSPRD